MRFLSRIAIGSVACGSLLGCSSVNTDSENLGVAQQAVNVCNETVPANRFVDGIPAYAQCSTTTGAIYSNNGVDTATTSGGTGWVRTQMSGGYQCTELAHRYLYFHWNVNWIPNGNAGLWCDTAPPATSGIVQTTTPVHGDLIVFPPGSCGADATTGHVALVDVVVNSTTVTIVEQNSAGRRNTQVSCAKCFLHVVANTGSGGAGGASSVGGSSATGGSLAAMGGLAGTGGSRATGGSTTSGNPSTTGGRFSATGGSMNATGGFLGLGGALGTGGAKTITGGNASTGVSSAVNTGGAVTALGGALSTGGLASTGTTAPSTNDATGGANADGTSPTQANVGGTGAAETTSAVPGSNSDEGSCGCKVPGRRAPTRGLAAIGLLFALMVHARRRKHTLL